MGRNWRIEFNNWMAILALAMSAGCVAVVQEELARQSDAGADSAPTAPRTPWQTGSGARSGAGSAGARRTPGDGFAQAPVDDDATEPATWAIVWHPESERVVGDALQAAPDAVEAFTSAMTGRAASMRADLLRELHGLAHPPVDQHLRWLPVTENLVFVPDADTAAFEMAAVGALRWEHRAKPTREGYYEFDAWHAVSRRIDPAKLPSEWRDLLDHPLRSAQGPRTACEASVQGLRVVAWLHPYSSDDPTADRGQPQSWAELVWARGERHLVVDLAPNPGCAVRKVTAWRSARLPAVRTFEEVSLSPALQRQWLARLLPSLRAMPSWRDQQAGYAAFAAECVTPTVAGRTPCRSIDLAPEWFAFATPATRDGLGELGDRLTVTLVRDGGDLWIKLVLRTETEPCGGELEFFGWHQSLWHAAGEATRPTRARLIRGLDAEDAGTADIDGDRKPDVLPEVSTPQEEICPC